MQAVRNHPKSKRSASLLREGVTESGETNLRKLEATEETPKTTSKTASQGKQSLPVILSVGQRLGTLRLRDETVDFSTEDPKGGTLDSRNDEQVAVPVTLGREKEPPMSNRRSEIQHRLGTEHQ